MKLSWMKLFSILDESVFGRKCFGMKVFLDEFFANLDESVPNRHAFFPITIPPLSHWTDRPSEQPIERHARVLSPPVRLPIVRHARLSDCLLSARPPIHSSVRPTPTSAAQPSVFPTIRASVCPTVRPSSVRLTGCHARHVMSCHVTHARTHAIDKPTDRPTNRPFVRPSPCLYVRATHHPSFRPSSSFVGPTVLSVNPCARPTDSC